MSCLEEAQVMQSGRSPFSSILRAWAFIPAHMSIWKNAGRWPTFAMQYERSTQPALVARRRVEVEVRTQQVSRRLG